jgi:hypothetical protein
VGRSASSSTTPRAVTLSSTIPTRFRVALSISSKMWKEQLYFLAILPLFSTPGCIRKVEYRQLDAQQNRSQKTTLIPPPGPPPHSFKCYTKGILSLSPAMLAPPCVALLVRLSGFSPTSGFYTIFWLSHSFH